MAATLAWLDKQFAELVVPLAPRSRANPFAWVYKKTPQRVPIL
jgi:hypothetical protein